MKYSRAYRSTAACSISVSRCTERYRRKASKHNTTTKTTEQSETTLREFVFGKLIIRENCFREMRYSGKVHSGKRFRESGWKPDCLVHSIYSNCSSFTANSAVGDICSVDSMLLPELRKFHYGDWCGMCSDGKSSIFASTIRDHVLHRFDCGSNQWTGVTLGDDISLRTFTWHDVVSCMYSVRRTTVWVQHE